MRKPDNIDNKQGLSAHASEAVLPSSSPSLQHLAPGPPAMSPLGSRRQQADRKAPPQGPQAWMGHALTAHSLDKGRGNYAGMPMPVLQQGHRHVLLVDLPASASYHIGAAPLLSCTYFGLGSPAPTNESYHAVQKV